MNSSKMVSGIFLGVTIVLLVGLGIMLSDLTTEQVVVELGWVLAHLIVCSIIGNLFTRNPLTGRWRRPLLSCSRALGLNERALRICTLSLTCDVALLLGIVGATFVSSKEVAFVHAIESNPSLIPESDMR